MLWLLYLGWTTNQRNAFGMSFTHWCRGSGSLSIAFEISSVSVRDAEGPGDSRLGVFIVGRSWCSQRQWVRRYHSSWCRYTFRRTSRCGTLFSTAKYQDFHSISIKIKGILLHSRYIREMTFRAHIYHTGRILTGNPLQSWELMRLDDSLHCA